MNKREVTDSFPAQQITVLLADDHAGFRHSLKLLLERDGDIQVIGGAKNGFEAVRLNRELHPAVIVMDLTMPLLNGLLATAQIMETFPETRFSFLLPIAIQSTLSRPCSVVHPDLIKQSSAHQLAQAVRRVIEGKSFFCAPIARQLRDEGKKRFAKGELKKRTMRRTTAV